MGLFPIIGQWAFDPDLLGRRMSFISGPRQVGKTTLALLTLKKLKQEQNYYNWDTIGVNRRFAQTPFFFLENIPHSPLSTKVPDVPRYMVVFDEFHKHPRWKQILKGYFDEFGSFIRFIVCGSARLDIFRKGGESLLGRYFPFRMFPLGPKDITEGNSFNPYNSWNCMDNEPIAGQPSNEFKEATLDLYRLTGFPEPFLDGREAFCNRWRDEHLSLLTTEEIRDLSKISDMVRLQTLVFLLPERVGSILSLNNLAHILSCAHSTVKTWMDALEQVFVIFRIPPFTKTLSRAIRKEKKAYFWDWGVVEEESKRFENFLAVQLARTISAWTEWGWGHFDLFFVRTKEGKETDFLITRNQTPLILIEAKLSENVPDASLVYFKERLQVRLAFQVLLKETRLRQVAPGVFVLDVYKFLSLLV
jgi:predicted AAA+ superfamily ATPase